MHAFEAYFDGNTHVATISAFAAVPFVFAEATFGANASIFAPLARPLTITSFLTLSAALATRFRREIFLVHTELMLKAEGRCSRWLAGLWGK